MHTCIALLFHFSIPAIYYDTGILAGPESINATYNSTTFFHCTGTGIWLNWFVDDHRQDTPQALARGIKVVSPVDQELGIINSTLTIPATMDNDNITILCAIAGDNGIARSPVALLRVKGTASNPRTPFSLSYITVWLQPDSKQNIMGKRYKKEDKCESRRH